MTIEDQADASVAEWTARAEAVIPGGVNSGRRRIDGGFVINGGSGAYLRGADGRRYLDFSGGASTAILGHGAAQVARALSRAADGPQLTGMGVTPGEVMLAEKLVDAMPSVEQVVLTNGGSDATYFAARLARHVTGRSHLITIRGGYDGWHDAVLFDGDGASTSGQTRGVLGAVRDLTHLCLYNDLEGMRAEFLRHPDSIAAVIMEPVAHNNGPTILPQPGYLAGVRDLCDEFGALLVFDEVITGFRHALGGYQEISGVMPDLTTAGKSLANGMPIGMIGGARCLMEEFTTAPRGEVMLGGTYFGNAASVAAAIATLDALTEPDTYERLYALGARMRSGLTEIANGLGVEAQVAGLGSIFTFWPGPGPLLDHRDVARGNVPLFRSYRLEGLKRGVLEKPDIDGARSAISLAHTERDIDHALEVAAEALPAALSRCAVAGAE